MALLIKPGISDFAFGAASVGGSGETFPLLFGGTWQAGDNYVVTFTFPATGTILDVGDGYVTGVTPKNCFTYKNKVYIVAGSTFYFSALDNPLMWNDTTGLNGNGFVNTTSFLGASEDLAAIANYQGKLAFFGRQTVQIWNVGALDSGYGQSQVLENIGTNAPLSVKALGDLDVLFLSDTGIRSLHVRDASNNAFVSDLGSPIDLLIQSVLDTCSASDLAAACAVVEPSSNRYWLYLKGTIYVFSYFPSAKVAAWATYTPNYFDGNGDSQTFTPLQWVVSNGFVIGRIASGVVIYGGTGHSTYDASPVTVETPWMDKRKPGTDKFFTNVDCIFRGAWKLYMCADYMATLPGGYDQVYDGTQDSNPGPTNQFDKIGWSAKGTHVKLKATTVAASRATLSQIIFHDVG